MTDEEIEAAAEKKCGESLRADGFLSDWMPFLAKRFREMDKDWFDYAETLNRVAQSVAMSSDDITNGKSTNDPIALSYRLLLRSLSGYQASLILSEKGIVNEANSLIRSVYENGFWMGYLSNDGEAARDALIDDEKSSGFATLKLLRRDAVSVFGEGHSEVREIDQMMTATGKGKKMSADKLAELSGFPSHYAMYKELSASTAHASLNSLYSYLGPCGDDGHAGHIIGPDQEAIAQAVSNACNALIMCLMSYIRTAGGSAFSDDVFQLIMKYQELGEAELVKRGIKSEPEPHLE